MMPKKKILIIGGGFGGINCALKLAAQLPENTKITLVSDKTHFEYHAALYRVVTGGSPMEVCIPLAEIFAHRPVEIVKDHILDVDLTDKKAVGESGSIYSFDYLVLAVGSETSYYDLQGLKEYSFGFKSIHEAVRLKRHLHETFSKCTVASPEDKTCQVHIVVIGGGASGTEIAGELALYTKKLAKMHQIDSALVTIDLIHADSRLVPALPERVSRSIEKRLRSLGVNLYLNRHVMKEDVEKLYLKDIEIRAKTVIWTAGIASNPLYKKIKELQFNQRGQVKVDGYLQAVDQPNVFVIGDGADTKYAGMAQTALRQGAYVSQKILSRLHRHTVNKYVDHAPVYAIPVGRGWCAYYDGSMFLTGIVGWFFRRLLDFIVFSTVLPFDKAWAVFKDGRSICETCEICSVLDKDQ